jgi:hypothetical protein
MERLDAGAGPGEAGDRASMASSGLPLLLLFVFVVLSHNRRRVVHFNVTENPSAEWTAQQIVEAFPWDTAPRSPWQNPFVERLIGSIRRECLDHVIVLSEQHVRRILREYFDYYRSDGGGLHHRYMRQAA